MTVRCGEALTQKSITVFLKFTLSNTAASLVVGGGKKNVGKYKPRQVEVNKLILNIFFFAFLESDTNLDTVALC